MVYPELGKSPYAAVLEQLSRTWHLPLCASIHPGLKELQAGNEPQSTFLDVWMGYLSKINPKRIQQKSPYLLQGALIHSTSDHLAARGYPYTAERRVGGERTLTVAKEKYAYTARQQRQLFHPSSDRGRHSFRLIWGNPACCHTFVLEGGNIALFDFTPTQDGIDLIVALGDPIQDDDREKNREIVFYADLHEDLRTAVNGQAGTVFNLNDQVSLVDKEIALSLQFSLLEGEGDFIGHLMRGNRPTQLKDKGANKFTAYDQQIILRTLRRSHPCRFCIRMTIK
jgi:hypothetical protein